MLKRRELEGNPLCRPSKVFLRMLVTNVNGMQGYNEVVKTGDVNIALHKEVCERAEEKAVEGGPRLPALK